jgi:hypothetical protein
LIFINKINNLKNPLNEICTTILYPISYDSWELLQGGGRADPTDKGYRDLKAHMEG